jgi:hypothetical protein
MDRILELRDGELNVADQGAVRVLDRKLLQVAQQNIGVSENIRIALTGGSGQALLALDDRIVNLKAGWLAGATFGGKATSFPYDQVSAIKLKAGPANAVLQVHSSAFQQLRSAATGRRTRSTTQSSFRTASRCQARRRRGGNRTSTRSEAGLQGGMAR